MINQGVMITFKSEDKYGTKCSVAKYEMMLFLNHIDNLLSQHPP
jgi:hypothetical protein